MSGVVAALTVIAVSTVATNVEQRKQSKEQEKIAREQSRVQQGIADTENIRSIRRAIRQSRIAQAQIENAAAVAGTQGSSGAIGGVASVGTTTAGELNYFGKMSALNAESNALTLASAESAARSSRRVGAWNTVGALGSLGYTASKPT